MEIKLAKLKKFNAGSFLVKRNDDGIYESLNGEPFHEEELVFPKKNESNLWLYQCAALQGLLANPAIVRNISLLQDHEDFMNQIATLATSMATLVYHEEFRCWNETEDYSQDCF